MKALEKSTKGLMALEKIEQQLRFLAEIDKMKSIYRHTEIIDKSRTETDAEHSWHLAMFVITLSEYAKPEVDINRTVKMALVHDLVEVYAGDTFAYDTKGYETKLKRENDAAEKLFAILPMEQGEEFKALWKEFDEEETPDAVFAAAMDRLQPVFNNYLTGGPTWSDGQVKYDMVLKRMQTVKKASDKLYCVALGILDKALSEGMLQK